MYLTIQSRQYITSSFNNPAKAELGQALVKQYDTVVVKILIKSLVEIEVTAIHGEWWNKTKSIFISTTFEVVVVVKV